MQLTMRNQPAAPSGWPEGVWLRTPLPLWLSQTAAPTLGWGPETVLLGQNAKVVFHQRAPRLLPLQGGPLGTRLFIWGPSL